MYEIYINETKLILTKSKKVTRLIKPAKDTLIAAYPGKAKFLLNYVDMMEKGTKFKVIVLHTPNQKQLIADFESLFDTLEAGGGLVLNELNEMLFIFRRGFWDLPKGKLEHREKKKVGALREVIEETGIKSATIIRKLLVTRHTYKNKRNKRLIKKTHWYLMNTEKQSLIPQFEEDITEAVWLKKEQFLEDPRPVFKNIVDILDKYDHPEDPISE